MTRRSGQQGFSRSARGFSNDPRGQRNAQHETIDRNTQGTVRLIDGTFQVAAGAGVKKQADGRLGVATDPASAVELRGGQVTINLSKLKGQLQARGVQRLADNVAGASGGNTLAAITDPTDDANTTALMNDLTANTIPDLRNAITTLTEKVNELLEARRQASEQGT